MRKEILTCDACNEVIPPPPKVEHRRTAARVMVSLTEGSTGKYYDVCQSCLNVVTDALKTNRHTLYT